MIIAITITILLLTVLFCLGYIWYLKFFKKHTRERFAFVGLSAIVGLITIFTIQIYSSQGVVNAVFNTSNLCLDTNYKTYETDYRDHFIVLVLISVLISFIYKIHQNWNGPISTIAAEKLRFKEENNIFDEFRLQFSDFFSNKNNKKIVLYKPNINNAKYSAFSSTEYEKSPWFEDVYELFVLRSNQYNIDLQNDFYQEESCYISKYGQNKEPIAIYCCLNNPSQSELDKFIKFAFSINSKYAKLIVAIKNIEGNKNEKTINGKKVEFRFENELLNSLVDFRYYAEYIKDQFTIKPITENGKIALKDFYVDLKARAQGKEIIENIENHTIEWLNDNHENKHLAILGEYGCGKSVFSLKLAYELFKSNGNRIPILIELRGKSPRNLSAIELLSTWASTFRIEPLALWKLHKEGKLVVIFEGFDEMDMVGDREVRFSHFQRLWEFATPKSKIIITGRPNFFLDDQELKINLGIDKPFETSHFCEAIYLEKLDKPQIKKALRNIESDTRRQVIDLLGTNTENSNFYDLVSRPAILYLVSVIWKERKLSQIKEQINSALIIGEFIQYSYSRQTDKKVSFPLTEHEREYFMLGVAVGMHKLTDLSNQVSKSDLENVILKLYRNFPNEILPNKNATQQSKNSLKERMQDNPSAEDMILTDVRSCGILVNDLGRKDYFKFAHKSFFEYLISLFFVESLIKIDSTGLVMVKNISNSLDISLSNFEHSKETMAFTAEILTSKLKLEVGKEEAKRSTAYSLFKILYPFKTLSRFPKLASALEVFASPKTMMLKMSLFIMSVTILYSIIILKRTESSNIDSKIFDSFSKTVFFAIPMFLMTALTYFRTLTRGIGSKRTQIWLNCCEQLNIGEDIITKIISKSHLKILKGEFNDNLYLILKRYLGKKSENNALPPTAPEA